ncbi:hypothetical protein X739_17070 [Mesorhizobium sp. LNHC220B00]|nr:hypothetical protein X739_17070 [Mesorhizobium sp. LNHC220B00]
MPSLVRILLYVGLFLGFGPAMAAPVIDAVPAGSRSDQSLPIHSASRITAGSSCACWTAGIVIGNGTTITRANATIPAPMAGSAMADRAVAGK